MKQKKKKSPCVKQAYNELRCFLVFLKRNEYLL